MSLYKEESSVNIKPKWNGLLFKTLILWFMILILASFAASLQSRYDNVGIQVAPEVLREGEPVVVTFYINNPSENEKGTDYALYANGDVLMSGRTELSPGTGRQFQYVYSNPLKLGEQVTFSAKAQSGDEINLNSVSIPSVPPQIWSSFVSFASFSTSIMSSSSAISSMSMSSMAYYNNSFGTNRALNAGLIFSIVLIILLIYMELSEPLLAQKEMRIIGNLRVRFSRLSSVLFIIFVGMVFTQIALIVGGV
ncbi:MAG: hypothetical protein C3F06_12975 [Candidatus Methanoperedenaceae archaeon]|nr:MAG: hypothetical protein C3F06_12975 [Candidatus Methanoperedenaceae archaeon]